MGLASMVMNESAIEVRKATQADLDQVFEIARDFATSFVVEKTQFQATFQELSNRDDALLLLVAEGREVLGYGLAFDHVTFYANGRVSWVEEIAVRVDRRESGLGRRLMEGIEEWAKARRSKLVGLATRRASAFYKALNYHESAAYFRKLLPDP
jgi:GNAT superfamily N-acetyltransferase